MNKFEYLVVRQENNRILEANGHWQGTARDDPATCPDKFAYLEEAGAQGWELVAVDPEGPGQAVLYFKRQR